MGEPKAVTMWYDAEKKRVGFKSAKLKDFSAYPVRGIRPRSRQGVVTGRKFCTHYGISYEESRSFPAEFEDGMLIIDLDNHNRI